MLTTHRLGQVGSHDEIGRNSPAAVQPSLAASVATGLKKQGDRGLGEFTLALRDTEAP